MEYEQPVNKVEPRHVFHMRESKRHSIIQARRERVSYYLMCGWSETAIAAELEVSIATISQDVAAVRDAWERSTIQNATLVAIRDLKRLDHIIETHILKLNDENSKISSKAAEVMIKAIAEKARILGYSSSGITIDVEDQLRLLASDHDYDPDQAIEIARKLVLTIK